MSKKVEDSCHSMIDDSYLIEEDRGARRIAENCATRDKLSGSY